MLATFWDEVGNFDQWGSFLENNSMKFNINKKYQGAFFLIASFVILFIIQTIVGHNVDKNLKEYGVTVVGEVIRVKIGRGPAFIQVRYMFNGKYIDNEFGTDKPDTFKVGEKFKFRISSKDPDLYIECLGRYK